MFKNELSRRNEENKKLKRGERKAKSHTFEVSRSKEEGSKLNVSALKGYPKASWGGGSK